MQTISRCRSALGAATLLAVAVLFTGCSSTGGTTADPSWHVDATCAGTATMSSITHESDTSFARPTADEHAPSDTGCSYVAGAETIDIATQSGPPSDVDYNDAAGIHNTNEPALGAGAHFGSSQHFCGAAVPASGGDTLTVTITTTGDDSADCSPLAELVKASATWR